MIRNVIDGQLVAAPASTELVDPAPAKCSGRPPAGGRDAPRGIKQSGYWKDLSQYGFEAYTRVKHVMHACA